MTEQHFKELYSELKRLQEEIKKNPEVGKELLIQAGIIDKNFELTENYK